jgi:hypothetical protein
VSERSTFVSWAPLGVGAALVAVALAACAPLQKDGDAARCFAEPEIFEWQALDDQRLLVWTHPREELLEVTLAEKIEGLTDDKPLSIELVDGDHDGEICSQGLDSATVWSKVANDGEPAIPVGDADVYFVDRLNDRALAERLKEYATTHGPKQPGDEEE